MLDIKFIRENPDLFREAARKKKIDFDVDKLLEADRRRLVLLAEVEQLRAEQNRQTDQPFDLEFLKELKSRLKSREEELASVVKEWQRLMIQAPNIPDVSVPEGKSEQDNVEVERFGKTPKFDFEPKDHVELMAGLGLADFERGVKAHGFRGYYLSGDGAELSWALWNYARVFFAQKRFKTFIAPAILRKEHFVASGFLPREAEDLFKTQDEDYFSGTAEVAMMAYHAGEILEEKDLPKRYLAFSPCFRREAGSYGKDTKGLFRVHEFYKIEQLILSKADHVDSAALHEEINRNFEEFVESLGLAYRRVLVCSGELTASKVKQYDTEVWFPSQNKYRELSSASYYHDFQSRRFNIRYRAGDKKLYVYSLNGTAAATPRLLAAVVENGQQADGSVAVPKVLDPYFRKPVIAKTDVLSSSS